MASSVTRKPLLARIFHRLPRSSAAHMPFRCKCPCGQTISGQRKRHALELVCPKCGNRLFVLPRSAWPVVTTANSAAAPAVVSPTSPVTADAPTAGVRVSQRLWLLPICVGLFALLTAGWGVWIYGPQVIRAARHEHGRSYRELQAAALEALEKGEFGLAAHQMEEAMKAWGRDENPPSRAEQTSHYRLLEQVRVLAELSSLSLEQVMSWAEEQEKHPGDKTDLKTHFPHRVFVFDSYLRVPPPQFLDEKRSLRLDYQVLGSTLPVELDLSNQEGLGNLVPLDKDQRWIVALRLESVELRANEQHPKGQWVMRFEPNRAVLLSDPRLFRTWRLHSQWLPGDVLERQNRLLIHAPLSPWKQLPVRIGATRDEVQEKLRLPELQARQFWKHHYLEQWQYRQRGLVVNMLSTNGSVPRVEKALKLPG